MQRVCSALLVSIEKGFPVTGLGLEFSRVRVSSQSNGLFNSAGVDGMREGKEYHSIAMVFPFICRFVDKAHGYTEDGELTKEKSLFFLLTVEIYGRCWSRRGNFSEWKVLLRKRVRNFKERPVCASKEYCDTGLFSINFDISDLLYENKDKLGCVRFLNPSA